jgi:hypothetical protein
MRHQIYALAFGAALVAAPNAFAEAFVPPLTQGEAKVLRKEITTHERALRDFTALIEKLARTERESSNSGRRRALYDLQQAMGAVIVAGERQLGEDYVITQHGQDVDEVRSDEAGSGGGVRTRKPVYPVPGEENAPPLAYYHLVRQQAIYIACRNSLEPAAAKQGSALAQYQALANEFAVLMRRDLEDLRSRLPAEPTEPAAATPPSAAVSR